MTSHLLVATGIENSNPTSNNGRVRMAELAKCGHYQFWRKDFDLVRELGGPVLLYGRPIYYDVAGGREVAALPAADSPSVKQT